MYDSKRQAVQRPKVNRKKESGTGFYDDHDLYWTTTGRIRCTKCRGVAANTNKEYWQKRRCLTSTEDRQDEDTKQAKTTENGKLCGDEDDKQVLGMQVEALRAQLEVIIYQIIRL